MKSRENNTDVERKITQTMNLLSNLDRAQPSEGLYSRILNRMKQDNNETQRFGHWMALWPRFSYFVTGFIILIILNVFTITYYLNTPQSQEVSDSYHTYVEEFINTTPRLYPYDEMPEE